MQQFFFAFRHSYTITILHLLLLSLRNNTPFHVEDKKVVKVIEKNLRMEEERNSNKCVAYVRWEEGVGKWT